MANLTLTLHATKLPVLMPLIGFDKEETIRVAKEIDTYEPSASSMVECTAVPRNPKTSPAPEEILEAESRMDVQALVKETIEGISEIVLA
jgi:thiamine biosynthesis protein ThiI